VSLSAPKQLLSSIPRAKWLGRFLFILIGLLFAIPGIASAEYICFLCKQKIYGMEIYYRRDKLTDEKHYYCTHCNDLPDECTMCTLPVKSDAVHLPDGRYFCDRDAKSVVLDDKEAIQICLQVKEDLSRHLSRFMTFPENVAISMIDRVNLMAMKAPGNEFDCPNILGYFQRVTNDDNVELQVSILSAMTLGELKSTCVHELTHAWVSENVSEDRRKTLGHDAQEGFCELVSYMLMDAQQEEGQKKEILGNAYTRGQIHLFVETNNRFGLNDIVDWIKSGADKQLIAGSLDKVHDLETTSTAVNSSLTKPAAPIPSPFALSVAPQQPAVEPTTFVLKGISGLSTRQFALINNQTLAVGESGKVRLAGTNVLIKVLAIQNHSARIRIVDSGEEQELSLKGATAGK
jgi:hypothetical protein